MIFLWVGAVVPMFYEIPVCPFCRLSSHYKRVPGGYYCCNCNKSFSVPARVVTRKGVFPKHLKARKISK